jgi:hypothetical protein
MARFLRDVCARLAVFGQPIDGARRNFLAPEKWPLDSRAALFLGARAADLAARVDLTGRRKPR